MLFRLMSMSPAVDQALNQFSSAAPSRSPPAMTIAHVNGFGNDFKFMSPIVHCRNWKCSAASQGQSYVFLAETNADVSRLPRLLSFLRRPEVFMKIAIAAAASIIVLTAALSCESAFAHSAVIQVNQPAVVAQPVVAQPPIVAEPVVVKTTTFAATYPGQVIYTCPVVPDCRLPNGLLYAGIYTDIDKHGYMFPYGI
jgi:hypothetical protein